MQYDNNSNTPKTNQQTRNRNNHNKKQNKEYQYIKNKRGEILICCSYHRVKRNQGGKADFTGLWKKWGEELKLKGVIEYSLNTFGCEAKDKEGIARKVLRILGKQWI